MIKKTITYTDYEGQKKTEDFWFNLSQAELNEMDVESGGMQKKFDMLTKTQDPKEIMAVFKDIIVRAYGERSSDGTRFRKFDSNGYRLAYDFIQTEAYSELFIDLFNDANNVVDFMIGILPQNVQAEARKIASEQVLPATAE